MITFLFTFNDRWIVIAWLHEFPDQIVITSLTRSINCIYIAKENIQFEEIEEMVGWKQKPPPKLGLVSIMMLLIMIWSKVISPALACTPNGGECKVCIVEQFEYGCPLCVPVIRCMARCLWGGRSRSVCVKRCDCNGGSPNLSDCKKCLSRCKCSCAA